MDSRQTGDSQERAALKAAISVRSGRRIDNNERAPRGERHWRTRQDPLDKVWESELVPLLEREPALTGMTLWEYLDEKYPGQYPQKLLRTLQRRIKHWRATEGPNKPVIFRQAQPPGQRVFRILCQRESTEFMKLQFHGLIKSTFKVNG